MKFTIVFTIFVLLFMSCNKNQTAVKKLDGTWIATNYEVTKNNLTSDYLDIGMKFKYQFDNCKLKENEYCQISIITSNDFGTETNVDIYRVVNNGNGLEVVDPIDNSIQYYSILKLNSNKLKLEKNENGIRTEITLKHN